MMHALEVREPWRGHLQMCLASANSLAEHIHRLKSQLLDAEIELKKVKDHGNDIVVMLATEGDLPKGAVYHLSQDGTAITCETTDPPKPEAP